MSQSILSILKKLARRYTNVDLSLIKRDIESTLKLSNRNDQYKSLVLACRSKAYSHFEWSNLAGNLRVSQIHENTPKTFSACTHVLRNLLHEEYYSFIMDNAERLNSMILTENDFGFDIFSLEVLSESYLLKYRKNNVSVIIETPQYLYLREATYLWFDTNDVENSLEQIEYCYRAFSEGKITQATPTMFNSGLKKPQLASCFTMTVDDNIQALAKSWHDCAIISKHNGGLGIDMGSVRHSEIGQGNSSRGIIPWIKVINEILGVVDQGGKRKGAGCIYLRDWHLDMYMFLDIRKPEGAEELRARNLFHAIMISDEFMRRVENDEMWMLVCSPS